jgi:GntR family transcriptional regulator, transcriptional repressor for pyruvate dehydrogenase complex
VTEAFAPIERRKVYEQVSERLEAQLGTALKAGDALPPERELAERYGVGRSSVREALRMLESRGLIESRGSGTFVVAAWRNPFQEPLSVVVAGDDVDRAQLFEVRRLLEAEAAALAATRRTIDQLNLMYKTTEDMEIELDSAERFIAADIRYHLVIAEATGNRLLLRLMQAIRDSLTEMFGTVFKFPGGPERSVAQHRLINEAIEAQDAERARRLMTEHILRVEQELAEIDD